MGQDVFENEMKMVNSVDYLRGLKGSDSVLITIGQVISESTLISMGHIDGALLHTYNNAFGYSGETDGSGIAGEFITFGILNRQVQIKVANDASTMKFRTIKDGTVGNWKYISVT